MQYTTHLNTLSIATSRSTSTNQVSVCRVRQQNQQVIRNAHCVFEDVSALYESHLPDTTIAPSFVDQHHSLDVEMDLTPAELQRQRPRMGRALPALTSPTVKHFFELVPGLQVQQNIVALHNHDPASAECNMSCEPKSNPCDTLACLEVQLTIMA
jgi:hypothetical protein